MKSLSHLFAFFLTLNCCFAGTTYLDEETKPSAATGKVTNGKIEVTLARRVLWTGEPKYPVTVSLKAEDGTLFLTTKITEGSKVELSGQIRRGNFRIYSDIDKASGYWPSYGGKVVIAADGSISITPQPIEHQLKMTLLAPASLETVSVRRPTLKWKPVPDAVSYTISWLEEESKYRKVLSKKADIPVTGVEWTFDADTVAGRTYEWRVVAFNKEGARIGYFASGYFLTK